MTVHLGSQVTQSVHEEKRKKSLSHRNNSIEPEKDSNAEDPSHAMFLAKYGIHDGSQEPSTNNGGRDKEKQTAKIRRAILHGVIDTSHRAYGLWLVVIAIPVMYNVVAILARSVFDELQREYRNVWLPLDYFSDVLYVIDIVVNSRTGYIDNGLFVRDRALVAQRYARSRAFPLDLLSVLPTDLLYSVWGVDCAALRLNRLVRVGRLQALYERAAMATGFPNLLRVASLIWIVLILLHWQGCLYYAVSAAIGFGTDQWVYPNSSGDAQWSDFGRKYVYCFYWATETLTAIGQDNLPVTDVEYFLVTVSYLVGVFVFANIIGSMSTTISSMNEEDSDFQRLLYRIRQSLKRQKVGRGLVIKVNRWFDHLRATGNTLDEKAIMHSLPDKLRAEIAMRVHMDALRKVKIFQDCEAGLLAELVLKLKPQVFSPGDYVCKKGDIGRELYIVKQGKLDVTSDNGDVVYATLHEGCIFGELSLLNVAGNKTGNRRTANVRSAGYSDLFVLSKSDFLEGLKDYPDAKAILIRKATEMLDKEKLIDEEIVKAEREKRESFERRVEALRECTDGLSVRMARLLADYEVLQKKLKARVTALEKSCGITSE